jgi:hypothetical protein
VFDRADGTRVDRQCLWRTGGCTNQRASGSGETDICAIGSTEYRSGGGC